MLLWKPSTGDFFPYRSKSMTEFFETSIEKGLLCFKVSELRCLYQTRLAIIMCLCVSPSNGCFQGRIELPEEARGHATSVVGSEDGEM